jgi:tetratricopeptide (TPR) repeat protein
MVRRAHHHTHTRKVKKTRLYDANYFRDFAAKELQNKAPQSFLGIPDEELGSMYQTAWDYLQMHESAQAVRSFTLLCQLHPYIAEFWFGLGKSLRDNGIFEEGLSAFLMAETIDPTQFDFYEEAILCCLEAGNIGEAKRIFRRLVHHKKTIEYWENFQGRLTLLKNSLT